MSKLTDSCPMPWGVHKGVKMEAVPASYLIWLYDNNKCDEPVREYIEDNKDVLDLEIDKEDFHADTMY